MKYAVLMERRNQTEGTGIVVAGAATNAGSIPTRTTAPAAKAGEAKKSKGKKVVPGNQSSQTSKMSSSVSNVIPDDWDWIDVLDDDPTIALTDIPIPSAKTIYDPTEDLTIRHTLSASLKNLRLPITAYQLNCMDDEQDVVWEHALAVWMRQGYMGDLEMNDEWLAGMLPEAWKRLWDTRKPSDIDEVAKKVHILQNIGRRDEALAFLQASLRQYPDDWDYWKLFFSTEVETSAAENFLDEMIAEHPDLRGPILVKLQRQPSPQLLMQYGEAFCERALCTHADIRSYLDNMKGNNVLLDWSCDMTKSVVEADLSGQDAASRRRILQKFIFAVKVQFSLQTGQDEKAMSMLIGWEILAKHWTMYKDFESTLKIDQVRKEKT
jgi:tetratricopeptide (TPR) repeat protein